MAELSQADEELIAAIQSGYGGVNKSGQLVDRRKHPDATPIPANELLRVPEPAGAQWRYLKTDSGEWRYRWIEDGYEIETLDHNGEWIWETTIIICGMVDAIAERDTTIEALKIALRDAVNSPKGVVPASAESWLQFIQQ